MLKKDLHRRVLGLEAKLALSEKIIGDMAEKIRQAEAKNKKLVVQAEDIRDESLDRVIEEIKYFAKDLIIEVINNVK